MAKEQDFNPRTAVAKYMEPTVREKRTQAEIEEKAQKLADEKIEEFGHYARGRQRGIHSSRPKPRQSATDVGRERSGRGRR